MALRYTDELSGYTDESAMGVLRRQDQSDHLPPGHPTSVAQAEHVTPNQRP